MDRRPNKPGPEQKLSVYRMKFRVVDFTQAFGKRILGASLARLNCCQSGYLWGPTGIRVDLIVLGQILAGGTAIGSGFSWA